MDPNTPKKQPWSVTLDFGEHANKTYGEIVLNEPGYARWMLRTFESQPHSKDKLQLLKETIRTFNELPFQNDCQNARNELPCDNAAEYVTTRGHKGKLSFWCTECAPDHHHAQGTSLIRLFTYEDALQQAHHVDQQTDEDWLPRAFIKAKTGELELTAENCDVFFAVVFYH